MAAAETLNKVLRFKLKLQSADVGTVLKTLKKLKELDITLDLLAETGIGKTVNSFRKHSEAGELARTLVQQWKKLVPKESSSVTQGNHSFGAEKPETEIHKKEEVKKLCRFDKNHLRTSETGDKKSHSSHRQSTFKQESKDDSDCKKSFSKNSSKKDLSKKSVQPMEMGSDKLHVNKCMSEPENKGVSSKEKKCSEAKISLQCRQPGKGKQASLETKKSDKDECEHKIPCENEKETDKDQMKPKATKKHVNLEEPKMSFESCLNYDLEAPKRKKKPCEYKKVKKLRTDPEERTSSVNVPNLIADSVLEEPPKKASAGSVMDLLKIPLPTVLPDCEDLCSFPYFDKKAEVEVLEVCEVAPIFTGQRLNKKMQVYSGSKPAFLPTMMTLYQQCIRTLQNNIDLLHEIGGVPFDILEPVLERCTPEQLLRIEDCNPAFVGLSDHLWERHCQRDFRNEKLEEYESWREMYLRLSEERERKLKRLTKSIVSAHSGKPKGRQVKLAFINSVAKPPRNVRIQQEIHGTAGPLPMPHAYDRAPEVRSRASFGEPNRPCSSNGSSSQGQDSRKVRRVAPMMAKSLKAFKKQLGRR
ncbi:transcription elongation factor B polypeptide 3-like [Arapaima gigas]